MTLSPSIIDRHLPSYHYSEKHEICGVVSTPDMIFSAIREFDDRRDPILNGLLRLRETPSRFLGRLRMNSALRERERFGLKDFHVLEQTHDEIVFALMGKFWRPSYGLIPIENAQAFASHAEPGSAKLVMSFSVRKNGTNSFTIRTETRVWCQDARARRSFLPYWLLIRPASGWIRRRILDQLKVDAMRRFQSAPGAHSLEHTMSFDVSGKPGEAQPEP